MDAKTERLLAAIEENLGKAIRDLHELRSQVAEENPTRDIIARWCERWKALYGSDYQVTKADAGQIKRLVSSLGAAELRARLGAYLKDRDDFLVKQAHPLNIFFKRVNGYGTVQRADEPAQAVGCKHTPRCADDVEHTRRKLEVLS